MSALLGVVQFSVCILVKRFRWVGGFEKLFERIPQFQKPVHLKNEKFMKRNTCNVL